MMEMTRPLGTFGHLYWLMYLLTALAAAVLVWGIRGRCRGWRLGQGSWCDRLDRPWERLLRLLADVATQRRFRRAPHSWLFHALFVWGFGIFLLGTVCLMLQEDLGLPTFRGPWYLFLSLALDLFALLLPAGIALAAWRRWVRRPEELSRCRSDAPLLLLLAALPITGLALEGVRMARQADPWGAWSPAGGWIAGLVAGLEAPALGAWHQGLWLGHLLLSLGFLAFLPFTRLFHLLAGPAALFFADRDGARALARLDFADEQAATFGAGRLEDLHWKRLLDADTCLGCGRCQLQCPAHRTGKPLSPKTTTLCLQEQLAARRRQGGGAGEEGLLAGGIIPEEALWACTTCRACEMHCPLAVEHVARTVDLRRYLVLTEARFPAELQTAFRSLESSGNPWSFPRPERGAWATSMGVPMLTEAPATEILLWTGCAAAYDPRARRAVQALAALLRLAEIEFAVLGPEESCCGDAARRLGNEYLFQALATENIARLSRYPIRTIVTACPHCFNALESEYPAFGGRWEVIHHAAFLARLLATGRLRPLAGRPAAPVAYHDSCYLARYHRLVAEPRAALTKVLGEAPRELARHGEETFCCGGGGGGMWLEDRGGTPLRGERVREIIASGVPRLATACPFCMTMLSDGLKESAGDAVHVLDIAEICAEACLPGNAPAPERRTP